ncbi:hypothetical protein NDU88_005961 [Pleurodeles waltl]|uniref:Uncharacterized protein n=1 Tax=Pleurodeles waltl TaxID=8319 RepID=A0AAV7VKK9_PLEWA|nr:hypothetical protein NDU88_005961 [Pleurodeles waltl]
MDRTVCRRKHASGDRQEKQEEEAATRETRRDADQECEGNAGGQHDTNVKQEEEVDACETEETRTKTVRETLEENATRTASRTRKQAPLWRQETRVRSASRTPEEPVTSRSYTTPEPRRDVASPVGAFMEVSVLGTGLGLGNWVEDELGVGAKVLGWLGG